MKTVQWTAREWQFGYTIEYIPLLIERLQCTAPRIAEIIKNQPEEILSKRHGDKWSVKEHIGHLTDIEELHNGRIDDFKNKAAMLRPADMSNKKTYEANHNQYSAAQLLSEFIKSRKAFIEKLRRTPPHYFEIKSVHPRLKQEVTLTDILFFVAEHDLQHLVRMGENLNLRLP
jgi:hypothetical protein